MNRFVSSASLPPPRASRRFRSGRAWLAAAILVLAGCSSTLPQLPSISNDPSARYLPGKFVWRALLTTDPGSSKSFYSAVFGWSFEALDKEGMYSNIRHGTRHIGTLVVVKPRPSENHATQWLSFLSVPDVDRATKLAKKDGKVLLEPNDVPGLGRVSIVQDPSGAPIAFLRSTAGDPADTEPQMYEWIWQDYVTKEPGIAWSFYREIAKWEAAPHAGSSGGDYWLLKSGDKARAGAFVSPWPNVHPNWLPYVRVENPTTLIREVRTLGGTVVLEPRLDVRNGSTAIILDPLGAAVALQKYPF